MHPVRVLFICKTSQSYGAFSYCRKKSGLYNSTRFIVRALHNHGIEAKIVDVVDNNSIDREVSLYKPTIVVIEALWVIPEKFPILKKLHPNVKWFIHLHSNIPFLAHEGNAIHWLKQYAHQGLGIIANSIPAAEALATFLPDERLTYLPNVYLPSDDLRHIKLRDGIINVGCFGAIRPLKNQLLQAMAALKFAREKGKILAFHINSSRVETGGDPIIKNLHALFKREHGGILVEHPWYEPEDFIDTLAQMDLGMQVSLSETFNVVTADYVTAGVPIVVSKEVDWVSEFSQAKDNSIDSIVEHMHRAWNNPILTWWNRHLLNQFSKNSQKAWLQFVHES